MKYIDSEPLRKEIEKNKNMISGLFTEGDDSVYDGENDAYNRVLHIIDSLQQEQPEITLEKEIDKEWRNCCPTDEGMGYEEAILISEQFHQIVCHFYELGLNARKEE